MSGSVGTDAPVRSAVPLVDLAALDDALDGNGDLAEVVRRFRPADLGRDLSRRSVRQGLRILQANDARRASAMLLAAHPAVAAALIESCSSGHATQLLSHMPTDYQVSVLSQLSPVARTRVEQSLPAESKAALDRQLARPASAVGRLMTTNVWRCSLDATVGDALQILHDHKADIEVAQNCYFVDGNRLVGVAALRELAIAPRDARIDSVMVPSPIAVSEDAERSDAAEIIQTHNFLSLPVVDAEGALVGAVRVDDLLDAALDKVGVGQLNQGGVIGRLVGAVPYFQTSQRRIVRSRITWLILLFVAETATGTVLRHFENELAKVVALSFFIPLLIGTGGNAGSQTVSTVIRALALGEVRTRDWLRVLWKEGSAGIMLGVLLGVIAFFRALLWGVDYDLALCVAITILVVCTWANTVGALIPLAAEKVGIDPTVISAPLITTLVDATGLFLYLTVAHLLLSQLR